MERANTLRKIYTLGPLFLEMVQFLELYIMEVTPLSQVKDLVKDDLLVNLKNKATSIKLDKMNKCPTKQGHFF